MMTQLRESPMRLVAAVAVALLLMVTTAIAVRAAGGYAVAWWTADGGGQTSTGASYSMTGTVAQPDADAAPATGGGYALQGGFWHNPATSPGDVYIFLPAVKTTQ